MHCSTCVVTRTLQSERSGSCCQKAMFRKIVMCRIYLQIVEVYVPSIRICWLVTISVTDGLWKILARVKPLLYQLSVSAFEISLLVTKYEYRGLHILSHEIFILRAELHVWTPFPSCRYKVNILTLCLSVPHLTLRFQKKEDECRDFMLTFFFLPSDFEHDLKLCAVFSVNYAQGWCVSLVGELNIVYVDNGFSVH